MVLLGREICVHEDPRETNDSIHRSSVNYTLMRTQKVRKKKEKMKSYLISWLRLATKADLAAFAFSAASLAARMLVSA